MPSAFEAEKNVRFHQDPLWNKLQTLWDKMRCWIDTMLRSCLRNILQYILREFYIYLNIIHFGTVSREKRQRYWKLVQWKKRMKWKYQSNWHSKKKPTHVDIGRSSLGFRSKRFFHGVHWHVLCRMQNSIRTFSIKIYGIFFCWISKSTRK